MLRSLWPWPKSKEKGTSSHISPVLNTAGACVSPSGNQDLCSKKAKSQDNKTTPRKTQIDEQQQQQRTTGNSKEFGEPYSDFKAGTNIDRGAPEIDKYPRPGLQDVPVESITRYAFRGAKVAASLSPIPGLDLALSAVENIVNSCRNVPKNRAAATLLAEHCQKFVIGIKDHLQNGERENMKEVVVETERLMKEINYRVSEWITLGFVESFVMQDRIAGDINNYHDKIEALKEKYKLAVYVEIIDWQQLHNQKCEEDHEELISALASIDTNNEMRHKYQVHRIDEVKREMLKAFSDFTQKILLEVNSRNGSDNRQRAALEAVIKNVYNDYHISPSGIEVTEGLITYESLGRPLSCHGKYDIYRQTCFGKDCQIQIVRRTEFGPKTRQRFDRQIKVWKTILEKSKQGEELYVLPLIYAICRENGPDRMLGFVTEWMENGNALDYVKKHGDGVDRRDLIKKIALGIKTLHTLDPPIAHGFIRSTNILIDYSFNPVLANFGLSRVVDSEDAIPMTVASVPTNREAFRWLAPEVSGIFPEGSVKPADDRAIALSTKSDIYGFSLTVLELMTEEKPFPEKRVESQVLLHLMLGGKPVKPKGETWEKVRRRGLDDKLWSLLTRCWATNINDRPTIQEVLEEL